MKLTPIDSPRTAPLLGAKTVHAEAARAAAMAKFNEGLVTSASPSEPGATLDPTAATTPVETAPSAALTPDPLSQTPLIDAHDGVVSVQSTTAHQTQDATEVDKEAQRIASHYANLARKEKMLRIREARINAKLAQSPTTPAPSAPQFDPNKYVSRDELVTNPFGVLNNLGLTYEQLTQKALEAPSPEDMEQRREIAALKSELQAIRDAQTKTEKTFEEQQTLARQQAELQIRQDVNQLLRRDSSFPTVRAYGMSNEITKLITATYDRGMGPDYPRGTVLDVYEAALMVEHEARARHEKILSRLNSNTGAPKTQQTNKDAPQTPALRTLTNSVGTTARKLSARERALAAFRGEAV